MITKSPAGGWSWDFPFLGQDYVINICCGVISLYRKEVGTHSIQAHGEFTDDEGTISWTDPRDCFSQVLNAVSREIKDKAMANKRERAREDYKRRYGQEYPA